jgi:hypothetical protein
VTLGDDHGWTAGSAPRFGDGARTAPPTDPFASMSQPDTGDDAPYPPDPPRREAPTRAERGEPALHLVVSDLRPANVVVRRPVQPVRAAGDAPGLVVGAAVLCGLLAVPMLATAGSLFGGASRGSTFLDLLLVLVTLAMAIGSVVGGVRMVSRGSPMLALLAATFTLVAVIGNLFRLIDPSLLDVLMFLVWAFFGFLTMIMVTLLRTRKARRWFTARNLEWLAARPAPKRRLFKVRIRRVSETPQARRFRKTKPRRVKQVGRHVRRRRPRRPDHRPGHSGHPLGFVGREAPD